MALTTWTNYHSAAYQSEQVNKHLWIAKGIGTNEIYVVEVDPVSGGFPITFAGAQDFGASNVALRVAALLGNPTGLADFGAGATTAQTLRVALANSTPVTLSYDTDWGTVGPTTLRTAAELGNEVGVADFGAGNFSAQTLRAVLASDQPAIPVSQSGAPWSVDAINFPATVATGAGTTDASTMRVVLPTDQSAIPVTVSNFPAAGPLDFGATTTAPRQAAVIGNATGAAIFGAGLTTAQTLRVVLPTDQTAIPASQSGAWSVSVSNFPAAGPLDFGASTTAPRMAALIGNATGAAAYGTGADSAQTLRTTLSTRAETATTPLATRAGNGTSFADFGAGTTGTTTPRVTANITRNGTELSYDAGASDANTLRVVLATGSNPNGGFTPLTTGFNDYSTGNVTTAAYTQLIAAASVTSQANQVEIFDSSGQVMIIAFGGAGSEVDQFYVTPGGNGMIRVKVPVSTRVSIKAKTATANAGLITVNLYA